MINILSQTPVTAPLLRYHGGKWRMADWIISHMPEHRVYVEPFGGGGSVLLRKPRTQIETYNDLDDQVVNLFAVLRNPKLAEQLARSLELTPYSRIEFFAANATCADPVEQARQLVVRSFMGFGSSGTAVGVTGFRAGYRLAGKSESMQWLRQPDIVRQLINRLRGVTIENRCALQLIGELDRPECLFYVDPPYVHDTRNMQNKTYRHEMSLAQHIELLSLLSKVKGMVLLSGYSHPVYDDALKGWQKITKSARAAGHRGTVERTECLWINPAAQIQSHDLFGGVQ